MARDKPNEPPATYLLKRQMPLNKKLMLEKYDSAKRKRVLTIKHLTLIIVISTTYVDSDGNYHSINKIEYDIGSDKFEITSNAFTFNKDSNATMLDLFNKILA